MESCVPRVSGQSGKANFRLVGELESVLFDPSPPPPFFLVPSDRQLIFIPIAACCSVITKSISRFSSNCTHTHTRAHIQLLLVLGFGRLLPPYPLYLLGVFLSTLARPERKHADERWEGENAAPVLLAH